MPATLQLDYFGWLVYCAFGDYPYLVGSALQTKQWRDVDVRLILSDDKYAALGLGEPTTQHTNPKWVAWTQAFAALGKQITGLPVDFQIQQWTDANRFDGPRSCLGIEFALIKQEAI
jgi:hypothetical protein